MLKCFIKLSPHFLCLLKFYCLLFFLTATVDCVFFSFLSLYLHFNGVFQRFLFDVLFFACNVFLVAIIVVVDKDVVVMVVAGLVSIFSSFWIDSFPFVGHLCCNTILHLVWIVDTIKSLTLILISYYLLFTRENLFM